MVTFLRKRGDKGEDKVVEFLKKRGFKIVDRNYQNRFGEIDIIAYRSGKLHFVEVKSTYSVFDAEFNMTKDKMNRILKTATIYLLKTDIKVKDFYFDLISIDFKTNKISLYPNINSSFID
jgi:putative endonuclease